MSATAQLVIGTRGSPLALAQAHEVRDRLIAAHGELGADDVAIRVIRTTGDRITSRPLAALGGKGLFTKEIEEALLAGEVDLAVHSLKDVPTVLPDGLVLGCYLERQDVRDAFISPVAESLDDLPAGARVGTASLRRQAQILGHRPDLEVVNFRGNVETRLRKLADGEVAATLLAYAGLRRLGREAVVTALIPVEVMLPAVGQGAIAIEVRADDAAIQARLAPLNHWPTEICVTAERALLAGLDGSCRTPIAAHAELSDSGALRLRAAIYLPDGSQAWQVERQAEAGEAVVIGRDAAAALREAAGDDFAALIAAPAG